MNRSADAFLRSQHATVLFEDEALLVLDKPSGVLVLPDRYDRTRVNLYDGLRSTLEEIFVVHRIDRETSGVLLFAKDARAHAFLSDRFQERSVQKTYWAVVRGRAANPQGVIREEIPLGVGRAVVRRRAETDFRVMETFREHCFVEAKPVTGRTHQIRIHLRSVGLPIVGDRLHGDGRPFLLSEIKPSFRPSAEGERPLLDRTALHAAHLTCPHPLSGQSVTFTAGLPKDMRAALHALRKYAHL